MLLCLVVVAPLVLQHRLPQFIKAALTTELPSQSVENHRLRMLS